MKRKSILMTVVALFLSGFAMAQAPDWWNGSAYIPAPVVPAPIQPGGVQGADTIYFCGTADSLYPIELGYDIAGKRLSPQYGDWKLYATTDKNATASDYVFGGNINGGAGNAFKVVASSIGGYIFQYTAKDAQCGLNVNETFWVYVFILPDLSQGPLSKDTIVCPDPLPLTVNADASFFNASVNYQKLYKQAGFTWQWRTVAPYPGSSATLKIDNAGIDTTVYFVFDLTAPLAAGNNYKCGLIDTFKYHLQVLDLNNLPGKVVSICENDTIGSNGQRDPNALFKRIITGTYNPAFISHGGPTSWTNVGGVMKKAFTFTYTDCNKNTATVIDSLILNVSPLYHFWGFDTATVCRPNVATPNLDLYYLYGQNAAGKPAISSTDSYWTELGSVSSGTAPNYIYTSTGSLKGGWDVDSRNLGSNIGYHYRWQIDGGAICFASDSGNLVVILQDPFKVQDYRAQLCNKQPSGTFDLTTFTGISSATFSNALLGSSITNGILNNVNTIAKGTYTIDINVPASTCGTASNGKFYLKITDGIKVPSSVEVKFCKDKLPVSINLYDIAGFYEDGGTWTPAGSISGGTASFNSATGIINIAAFTANGNTIPATYTFTYNNSGSTCVGKPVTVKITFANSII